MERRTVRHVGFWLAIGLIVGTSLLAFFSLRQLLTVGSSVDRTQEILFQLEHVNSLLKDANTAQRGFILTGDEQYLEPYRAALDQREAAIDKLRALAADSPATSGRVAQLERLIDEQLVTLARAVPLRRNGGPEAVDMTLLNRSNELMETIRVEIASVAASENQQLRLKEESAQRQAQLSLFALSAGIVVSCGTIIVVFLMGSAEARRRRAAEAELVQLNATLEQRVTDRAAELSHANQALRWEAEQRRMADDALRGTSDRMMAIISAAPFGIYLLDPDGKVVMWNAGAERVFGYSTNDIMGQRPPFLEGVDLTLAWEDMAMLALGRPPKGIDLDLTNRAGKKIHVRMFSAVIQQSGRPLEMLHIVEDLTERREIEQQLRQAQKMEVVGQLTGGMAHDFNNLLTIIIGNLDVAQEKLPHNSPAAGHVESAVKGALRGAELTQRLLTFARKQTLQPRIVNLNEMLGGTVAMLERMLGATIAVSVTTTRSLWPALVDPSQVEDAILNLAVNARDAMPEGGQLLIETSNVTLDADYVTLNPGVLEGDYVVLSVGDTGSGMTPETLERAFEPFFTTKEKGKGTGLGLSMIYGFVKQSGGHIKIYSELGHGTTVRIYLPRARDGVAAETASEPVVIRAAPGNKTVLVVEDNLEVRQVAVRMLGDLGYKVVEAAAADAALETLRGRDDIDVLFTDVVMPGKRTGYDLAVEAKSMKPDLRILLTSGYSEVFMKQRSEGLRTHQLGKPYRKQELAAKLRDVLEDVEV